jgi:hypothetical protein
MAATTLRERFIDDTDPAVQYATNDWLVADPGTINNVGNYGSITLNTSHATISSKATLSFAFNGALSF